MRPQVVNVPMNLFPKPDQEHPPTQEKLLWGPEVTMMRVGYLFPPSIMHWLLNKKLLHAVPYGDL